MENLRLDRQICFPLWLCAKEITRAYGPLLEEFDLTYTQYIAMLFFWQNGEATASELSQEMRLGSNTTTPVIERLVEKGYLERRRSDVDGRAQIIVVTPKGEDLKRAAVRIPQEMGACVSLEPDEAATLHRLLYKIIFNLEKEDA
ncbi:MarR family transcriptional regulator [Candidatus Saccharibacteria bacterium]|nr:MarR family transcriptional regulator [Candidatus Saccharibacteria bacterium]